MAEREMTAQSHRGTTVTDAVLRRCRDGLEQVVAATRCACGATKPAGTLQGWEARYSGSTFSPACPQCAGRERR
jgi:hypothetical protein